MFHLYFIIASSFFFGGIVKQWMLTEKPLDSWEKLGLILHPIIVLAASISLMTTR